MLFHTIGILVCLAAITKYHRPSGSNDKCVFHSSETTGVQGHPGCRVGPVVLTAPGHGQLSAYCVFTGRESKLWVSLPCLQELSSVGLVLHLHDLCSTFTTSQGDITGTVSKYSHVRGLDIQHMNLMGDTF